MAQFEGRSPFIARHVDDKSFVGEAVLEASMNYRELGLYNLIGLDAKERSLVGIHAIPTKSYGKSSGVTVLSVDLNKRSDEQKGLGGLAGAESLDVIQFETGLTFENIKSAMKNSSIFYKAAGLKDTDFYVFDTLELPAEA